MLHILQNLACWPRFDHVPLLHHYDLIREISDNREVMGDHQKTHVKFRDQLFEQRQDFRLCRHIQRRCRLVSDQQFGTQRDGHGDDHALPLPAG